LSAVPLNNTTIMAATDASSSTAASRRTPAGENSEMMSINAAPIAANVTWRSTK